MPCGLSELLCMSSFSQLCTHLATCQPVPQYLQPAGKLVAAYPKTQGRVKTAVCWGEAPEQSLQVQQSALVPPCWSLD